MSGHVFIVHGDITQLACDAWLLPGGPTPEPGRTWIGAVGDTSVDPPPADWGQPQRRVVCWRARSEGAPEPWLADVGGSHETPIAWYVDAALEFLGKACAALADRPPRHRRARHLVALPLVGTGQGGKRREAGAVARELLPALYRFTEHAGVDVALVMIEGSAYSAVQSVRREEHAEHAWRELEPRLITKADHVAEIAARRELVLFIGAGVGAAAGLPLWGALLDDLARDTARMSEQEIAHLGALSVLDRARVIEHRLDRNGGDGPTLAQAVAQLLIARASHYALGHALLAALPVDEAITTNYDTLFEAAARAASHPVTVLPYERLEANRRWLLKLHGSVERPDDIVLTRDNFLAYRERREALAGIVQALLITRHMLFVGFSLEDDNFHQIVRAVRRAVPGALPRSRPFGSALVVSVNPLMEELWSGALDWISFGGRGDGRSGAQAARTLEIFLDRVAAGASSASAHLFDARWDEVLTAGEREVRDLLREAHDRASAEARATPAFGELLRLMERLGHQAP